MNQSRAMRIVAYPVTAILMAALAAVVLFAACFVYETEKKVALWALVAIIAICATPHFRRRLRERGSIFFLLVTGYLLLAGASTFYAYAPKFALSEFSRLLAAYAVFLAVFSFAKRETLPNAAAVLCGATSLLSLLHLDAASGGLFAHDIMRKFQVWTAGGYNQMTNGIPHYGYNTSAGRLMGLFGNSNTMATMCAIGIFLALYLVLRAKGFRRLLPCAALVINAVTFLMCISIGATMSLGITVLLVLLCLRGADNRMNFLLVTLETVAISAAVAMLSFPHMGNKVPTGYLVLLYCAVGWLILFGVDWLLRPRAVNVLCKKIKILCICCAVFVGLAAAAGIVAFTQTAPVTLQDGETLVKRFFPGAGSCEITVEMEGAADIWIASADQGEILMGTYTLLHNASYDGPITVDLPENTMELQIQIKSEENSAVTVQKISYVGTQKSDEIAAGYRFLPLQIVNRLQGLTTNHSATKRIMFMQDGLKMWKQTPLFGRGLGGFENGLASVQSFFYETKYAHNHYVQVLCDLGIVGLLTFVSLLVFAIRTIFCLRKQDGDAQALYPALLGAVVMFTIHSGLEISASVAEVSIFTFGTFGLVANLAPSPALLKKHGKMVAWSGTITLALLSLVYGFFLYQNARASEIVNQETVTTSQLKQCVEMDAFEGDDFRLTYVVAAMAIQDEEVYQQADIYADELQAGNSNATGSYLTEYYLHRGYYEKAAAASEKFLRYTRSNIESWNEQFRIFENAMLAGADSEGMEQIAQIALDTYQEFQTNCQRQIDTLELNERSTSFLTRLRSTEGTLDWRVTSLLYDSAFAPDTDADGRADNVALLLGNVEWLDGGGFTVLDDNSRVRYSIMPTQAGMFTLTIETHDNRMPVVELIGYEPEVERTDNTVVLQVWIPEEKVGEALDLRLTGNVGVTVLRVSGVWTGV